MNPSTGEEEWYFPEYDRSHQLNIVESYNFTNATGSRLWGAEFKVGTTYSFGSGQPTAIPEMLYFNGDDLTIMYSYFDTERLPFYSRFDMSLKLKWQFKKWSIEPYMQVTNLFKHKNVWTRSYQPTINEDETLSIESEDSTMFPRLPFIGVNIKW